MSYVYLAGPIGGLSYDEAVDWRQYAQRYLTAHRIVGLSPLRFKEYLADETVIGDGYLDHVLSCDRGIMTRDEFDVNRADLVLVNLLGATTVSIGTMIELGLARAAKVPVVLVIEPAGNPHEHAMVREIAGFRCTSLDEALIVCAGVINPGADRSVPVYATPSHRLLRYVCATPGVVAAPPPVIFYPTSEGVSDQ